MFLQQYIPPGILKSRFRDHREVVVGMECAQQLRSVVQGKEQTEQQRGGRKNMIYEEKLLSKERGVFCASGAQNSRAKNTNQAVCSRVCGEVRRIGLHPWTTARYEQKIMSTDEGSCWERESLVVWCVLHLNFRFFCARRYWGSRNL